MSTRRNVIGQIMVETRTMSEARDPRGNRTASYSEPFPVDIYSLYPRTSLEPDAVGRRPVITGMTAIAVIEAKGQIHAHDRVRLPDGTLYEVDGHPGVWEDNPHARVRVHECVQVELKRTEG